MTSRITHPAHGAIRCPVCGGTSVGPVLSIRTVKDFTIERCGGCELVFASPRPTPKELDEFYSSSYFQKSQDANLGYADYRAVGEVNARRMWHDFLRYASAYLDGPRSLLDVGCATGGFLAEAKAAGWEGVGVEMSQYAVDVANKELGLNVICGDIFSPGLEPQSFRVVTMWHVLEHLIDPLGALERGRALLSSGGFLFIELPNWNSLGRVAKGASWGALTPPEHINFFTPTSLRRAVEKVGLTVLRCDTRYPSMMDRAAVRRPSRPIHLGAAAVAKVACRLGYGGYVRLLAQKAE